jgi:predicted nucleic acid-binding protein
MSKPTIYVETTVIGHIAGRQQSDITVAARQLASRNWWDVRERYQLFVSQIVLDECSAGGQRAATERIELIGGISVLDTKATAETLAISLMDRNGIPQTEPRDALHIAIAAVGGIEYLLTWNFKHIANPSTRDLIQRICQDSGYTPPIICSPDEIIGV